MSRQFNPAIVAYKNLQIDKSLQVEPKSSSGLLTPTKKQNEIKQDNMSEPAMRVYREVEAIRRKRMEENV